MLVTNFDENTGDWHCMVLDVTLDQLSAIRKRGRPIEDVLPHLDQEEKEFLLYGTIRPITEKWVCEETQRDIDESYH